jgi:TRAP transporter TAXI family solute receptor
VLNDLPEDLVYRMTKVFFEKKDDIAKAHAAGKFIDLANAIQGIAVPIHPGAAKYYKEKGLIK